MMSSNSRTLPNKRNTLRRRERSPVVFGGTVLVPKVVVFCFLVLFGMLLVLLNQHTFPSLEIEQHLELQQQNPHKLHQQPNYLNPLAVPIGQAVNLPSIRTDHHDDNTNDNNNQTTTKNTVENVDDRRKIYGGKGDGKHLGGFTEIDMEGISPAVWKHFVKNWTVHSVLDVGCGRGISTSWFYMHGLRVQAVEGSHDAVENTVMPPEAQSLIVEHDFSRGPWWPKDTFDVAWGIEFLEHVNLQYQYNYVSAFRKAALVVVTSSRWGGWHHVEVHPDEWWIRKFQLYGFQYDPDLTEELRDLAIREAKGQAPGQNGTATIFGPTGKRISAKHLTMSIKVFRNPVVASLPQHAHLFGTHGCYKDRRRDGTIINRECGTGRHGFLETPLDPSFYPLEITQDQDLRWEANVEANIQKP